MSGNKWIRAKNRDDRSVACAVKRLRDERAPDPIVPVIYFTDFWCRWSAVREAVRPKSSRSEVFGMLAVVASLGGRR